ncbi:cytochrome P450 [Talaromyces proteolyticus]|uniref:Cytochrome P450 n=1 Tax=Talaromyces proteolyticus TaxID=1131652 RepID=A0AAD4KD89_9EURO|nr:cytochrome P450 [Talaromyces proteolyticus]KAH8688960.1 cytochrome P450 [Talaromyces proteolyticus]
MAEFTFNWNLALVGLYGLLGWLVTRTIYRLYFHPLHKIPGPRLAAATHIVEFYYDVVKGGKYIWEIERMHAKYGPIVRINPRQIHINDPEFYEQIYAGSKSTRDKDTSYPPRLSASLSVISTIPHNHHRLRRSVMNRFFSKQSVVNLEPIIQDKTDKLADHFEAAHQRGTVLKMEYAFSALTADVITHYCYGTSYRYLEDQFPENDLRDAFGGLFLLNHILYFFPPVSKFLNNVPPKVMQFIDPKSSVMAFVRGRLYKQSVETLQQPKVTSNKQRETIFDALLDPSLPPSEKTVERLTEEGFILLGAGSETTANTMALAAYHLTKNKLVLEKLRAELKQVMPSPKSSPCWSDLEQLPYLTAVINETLRLAIGGSWRLPRVSPNEALVYENYVIPAGTPMITASYFVHMNPIIFPNPEKFDPDRWIRAHESGERLSRFIVSFSKGTRQCIGINMAYAELYLVIARIVRQFDLELCETTEENVRFARDYVVPHAENGPWSVKARIIKVIEE